MSIDLIKSYLVGIGFQVDENSFNKTNNSMNEADKTINKFNKNSQEGFSNTSDVLKDFFSLLNSSSGTLGKLFPELQGPFKSFIRDIGLVKKLYSDLTIQMEKPKTDLKTEPPKSKDKSKQTSNSTTTANKTNTNPVSKGLSVISKDNNTGVVDSSKNLVEQILNTKDAAKGLAEEGGSAFKLFSVEALGPIAAVVAGAAVAVLAIRGLTKYLNELANQDIEYEKLSRQLWTTKENAKEVDMALKTMGVTMQDLWLSPTLLKQFNELRKDSKELKLPKEYTDNLKVVQGIGLEFSRLKQLGSLAFQWIGNSILKYAAGPLKEIQQAMKDFNNWFIKNIPEIAKEIGVPIGILIRGISDIIQLFALIIEKSPFGQLIKWLNSLPEPVKNTIRKISLLIQPLILILALLDDLMTYFKGGKSLTGTFIDKIAKGFDGVGEKIKNVIGRFKNLKKEILNSDIVKWFGGVGDSLKKGIDDFKKGDYKDFLGDLSVKVKDFSNPNMNKVVSSYATSNTSNVSKTTTQNSHNSVKNENTFNVYGGNDANSTGKTVKNHVNGITQRNLQGAF